MNAFSELRRPPRRSRRTCSRWPTRCAWAFALCLAPMGCAKVLGDNQAREADATLPAAYAEGPSDAGATPLAQRWWGELFADPELAALIDAALDNNQELNIQMQEIIIAGAEVGARKGEYLPRLDGRAGVGVEKVGARSSQGVSDEAHGVPTVLGDLRFGLAASWEVDVWGKLRKAARAANERYLATIDAKNFLVTQLVAEISRSYYDLVAVDAALEVVERYVEITEHALEAVRLKKEAARATELAVQRFEAELAKAKAHLFELQQEQVLIENRLNFLAGRFPQPVARSDRLRDPTTLSRATQAGLPRDLLDNRPDVRAATHRLEAAKLDTKSAKAAFYPSLTIDAGLGYESFNAAHLLQTPESLAFGVAGGLVAPLLNRKAIASQYQQANALQIQAVLEFERSLLQAFTEVANQLAKIRLLEGRRDGLAAQVDTLEKAVEVSDILYRSAHADYMEVLLTRRDAVEAQLDLIEVERDQMQAVVGLYQALGGGWRREAPTTTPTPNP